MAEPSKVSFSSSPPTGETARLMEGASILGITTLTCCGPIAINSHEVQWANMDMTDPNSGEGGVMVQFKNGRDPVFFSGLDGIRVLKILQDAGKDIPDPK